FVFGIPPNNGEVPSSSSASNKDVPTFLTSLVTLCLEGGALATIGVLSSLVSNNELLALETDFVGVVVVGVIVVELEVENRGPASSSSNKVNADFFGGCLLLGAG